MRSPIPLSRSAPVTRWLAALAVLALLGMAQPVPWSDVHAGASVAGIDATGESIAGGSHAEIAEPQPSHTEAGCGMTDCSACLALPSVAQLPSPPPSPAGYYATPFLVLIQPPELPFRPPSRRA